MFEEFPLCMMKMEVSCPKDASLDLFENPPFARKFSLVPDPFDTKVNNRLSKNGNKRSCPQIWKVNFSVFQYLSSHAHSCSS